MDLRTLLKDDFDIDFPISGGTGNSRENPIVIHKHVPNDNASIEYGILRYLGIGRGVEWKVIQQSLLEHNGRMLDQLKIETKETSENEIITQVENYYFDITESFGSSKDDAIDDSETDNKTGLIGIDDKENDEIISTFFNSQEEAIKFLVGLKEERIASPNGKYIATLRKEEEGKWLYMLFNTQEELYVGDYVSPFRCSQENIDRFNVGTKYLADLMRQMEGLPEHERDALVESLADHNTFGALGYTE